MMTWTDSTGPRPEPRFVGRPGRLTLLLVVAALMWAWPAGRAVAQQAGPQLPPPPGPALRMFLTYDASITDSYTGPVYVVFAVGGPPRSIPRPFGPDPIVVVDVEDWRPGAPLIVDASNARCAPMDFEDIKPGNYFAQAFLPINPNSSKPGDVGNAASRTIALQAPAFQNMPLQMNIDRMLKPVVLGGESDRILTDSVPSELLSSFHGEDLGIGYTVVLPPGYFIESERTYPVRYWFGSHGATYRAKVGSLRVLERNPGGNDIITVLVQVTTRFGHPLFVNSEASGPWERAFIEELLPRIEGQYRADPRGRFLTGHAAGAWSSLWLQLNHPDVFQGAWAISPWPATFESWFGADLYTAENAYTNADGSPRAYGYMPDGRPVEPARLTWRREAVIGNGGPYHSFEWAYSPKGEDGEPMSLFDRTTGAIDRDVIEHWKQFDLVKLIEERGAAMAEAQRDRITLRVGGADGYRLDEPTLRLSEAMTAAGIEHVFNVDEAGTHASVADVRFQMASLKAMVDRYAEIVAGDG